MTALAALHNFLMCLRIWVFPRAGRHSWSGLVAQPSQQWPGEARDIVYNLSLIAWRAVLQDPLNSPTRLSGIRPATSQVFCDSLNDVM